MSPRNASICNICTKYSDCTGRIFDRALQSVLCERGLSMLALEAENKNVKLRMKTIFACSFALFSFGAVPLLADEPLTKRQQRALQALIKKIHHPELALEDNYECLLYTSRNLQLSAKNISKTEASREMYFELEKIIKGVLRSGKNYQKAEQSAQIYRNSVEEIGEIYGGAFTSVIDTICFTDIDWMSKYILQEIEYVE